MQGFCLGPSRVPVAKTESSREDLALEVVAMSGMMKEILHSLPRPWPEDLPERVTRLFLHGIAAERRVSTTRDVASRLRTGSPTAENGSSRL